MKQIRELRAERAELVEKCRHLVDIADGEKRALSDQETRDYDGFMSQIESLNSEITRREKLQNLQSEIANNKDKDALIGMEDGDLRKYSIVRLIRAMASGDWREAGLEREASDATAKKLGMEPRGAYVPQDWLERRDLTKDVALSAGNLIGPDFRPESFIEMLRNRMVLQRAGAQFMGGLVGDVTIPRQTGGATVFWVEEGASPTESDQVVGQVPMSPKTVGAFTDYSRKLIKQSSIDVEQFVRRDLAAVVALGIDRAGLHGTGVSNQPPGVAATAGIGMVIGGTNGLAPTWAHIVELETLTAVGNADIGSLAYITNPRVRGRLKTSFVGGANTDLRTIWDREPNPLNGYPAHVTNQVRGDLTRGSGTNLSAIFFGNWADLMIGQWGGLDVLVDPYTHSTSGTVRVVALQDVDVAVRNAVSFAAMLDAIT